MLSRVSTFALYTRTPRGLEDVSGYPRLIEYLISQGNWTNEDVIKLIGGNILRVMEENEKVRVQTFLECAIVPSHPSLDGQ